VEDWEEREIARVGRLVIPPEPERHGSVLARGRKVRVEQRVEGALLAVTREPEEREQRCRSLRGAVLREEDERRDELVGARLLVRPLAGPEAPERSDDDAGVPHSVGLVHE